MEKTYRSISEESRLGDRLSNSYWKTKVFALFFLLPQRTFIHPGQFSRRFGTVFSFFVNKSTVFFFFLSGLQELKDFYLLLLTLDTKKMFYV